MPIDDKKPRTYTLEALKKLGEEYNLTLDDTVKNEHYGTNREMDNCDAFIEWLRYQENPIEVIREQSSVLSPEEDKVLKEIQSKIRHDAQDPTYEEVNIAAEGHIIGSLENAGMIEMNGWDWIDKVCHFAVTLTEKGCAYNNFCKTVDK